MTIKNYLSSPAGLPHAVERHCRRRYLSNAHSTPAPYLPCQPHLRLHQQLATLFVTQPASMLLPTRSCHSFNAFQTSSGCGI